MADAIAIFAVLVILWAVFSKNLLATTDSGGLAVAPDLGVVPETPQPGETSASPVAPSLGSKITLFAQAIAHAEGFGQPGAVPTRFNNPGDLGPGDTGVPGVFKDGSVVSQLPDVATGWRLLEQKISNAFNGQSSLFNTNMTFMEWSKTYVGTNGDWVNNAKNIGAFLGVDPNTRIADWLQQ